MARKSLGGDMHANDKIKSRVQKLLNQAADREGTPEGDIFYEKAFALMAQYGLEASQLGDEREDEGILRLEFSGTYTDMQARLATALAKVLHCVCFVNSLPRSTRVYEITIFGAAHHRGRVEMLFHMLNLTMAGGAARISGPRAVSRKRSYMLGFIHAVTDKIRDAENAVMEHNHGYGTLVIDHRSEAVRSLDKYLESRGLRLASRKSNNTVDPDAYDSGADAGRNSDLGQTRLQGRRALAG
ncbi:DUF2786 domain-containing protein [Corynebacterium renale]|nr:DUF2786 domain-containing protein [Corynebacterium renale]